MRIRSSGRGSEGVDQSRHDVPRRELFMTMSIGQLMDKITDGDMASDTLASIGSDIEDGVDIDLSKVKGLHEDLSLLRYNYTIEVLIKTICMYMIRSKSCLGASVKDYKRALRILKFVISETEELYEAEQEE